MDNGRKSVVFPHELGAYSGPGKMQISRRLTNGLAWTGLLLVVGVPSADIVTAQFMGKPEIAQASVGASPIVLDVSQKPRLDQVTTAEIAGPPVAPVPAPPLQRAQVAAANTDPVDKYLQSGRPLPSYISDGDTQAAEAAPALAEPEQPASAAVVPATQTAPATPAQPAAAPVETAGFEQPEPVVDPVEVASIAPGQKIAPVPMPLSMRPRPVEPVVIPAAVEAQPQYGVVPPQTVAGYDDVVTAEELRDWESGPLSEFLAKRHGFGQVDPDYDPDGFFLDEGPNSSVSYRRQAVEPPVVMVYPLYD